MSLNNMRDILGLLKKRFPEFGTRLKEAEAIECWPEIVGNQIAKHAKTVRISENVLLIEVDHPIWRTELHHRKKQILDKLKNKYPAITDIKIINQRTEKT